MLYFAADLETTGTWRRKLDSFHDDQPAIVQIGGLLFDEQGETKASFEFVVSPNRVIPDGAIAVHGITNERAEQEGVPLGVALEAFYALAERADVVCGHNFEDFDARVLICESKRWYGSLEGIDFSRYRVLDTMKVCEGVVLVAGPLAPDGKAYDKTKAGRWLEQNNPREPDGLAWVKRDEREWTRVPPWYEQELRYVNEFKGPQDGGKPPWPYGCDLPEGTFLDAVYKAYASRGKPTCRTDVNGLEYPIFASHVVGRHGLHLSHDGYVWDGNEESGQWARLYDPHFKFPSLEDCTRYFFRKSVQDAHSALADCFAVRDLVIRLSDLNMLPALRAGLAKR